MRKIILSVVILFALIFLGGPFFIGLGAENLVQNFVKRYNAVNHDVDITLTHFQRSWFSSAVSFTVKTNQGLRPQGAALNFTTQLKHGPFIWFQGRPHIAALIAPISVESLQPEVQQFMLKTFGAQKSKPQLLLSFEVGIFGKYTLHLAVPAFDYQNPTIGKGKWKGLDFRWKTNHDLSKQDFVLDFNGGQFTSILGTLELAQLHSYAIATQLEKNLWTGKFSSNLESLGLQTFGGTLDLKNLSAALSLAKPSKTFTLATTLNLDTLNAKFNSNGPFFTGNDHFDHPEIGPLKLSFEMKDIDSQWLEDQANQKTPPLDKMHFTVVFHGNGTILGEQFTAQATLSKMAENIPEKGFALDADVRLSQKMLQDGITYLVLLTAIGTHPDAKLLDTVSKQASTQIADWKNKKYLKEDGKDFTVKIHAANGKFLMNDQMVSGSGH